MPNVTVKYKGTTIAEMSGNETKTLKTRGTYCEDDISVEYVPPAVESINGKVYEFDLSKTSGWIPLVTLDDEVVSHINDPTLVVCLRCVSDYTYEQYVLSSCTLSNASVGKYNDYNIYGGTVYPNSPTAMSNQMCFYPPNKTDTSTSIGGGGMFRLDASTKKYYFRPGSYYTRAGKWRLTFTW